MGRKKELQAELAVAELEEELVKAKQTKAGPSRALKDAVRAARQKHREAREAERETAEGDAVVQPDVVQVAAETKDAT